MAFHPQGAGDDDVKAEINIVPLVDIMLVLLIIFMVAAPLMNDHVDINLPKAQAKPSTASEDSSLSVAIKKDGSIFLGKTPVTFEEFSKKLPAFLENREKKDLIVRADESAAYGIVVKVMAVAQNAGATHISLLTDPSK